MAEWFKAAVLKTVEVERLPGVRIPSSPNPLPAKSQVLHVKGVSEGRLRGVTHFPPRFVMLVTALREMPAPPTGVALRATTTSRPHGGVYAEDDGQFTSLTRRSVGRRRSTPPHLPRACCWRSLSSPTAAYTPAIEPGDSRLCSHRRPIVAPWSSHPPSSGHARPHRERRRRRPWEPGGRDFATVRHASDDFMTSRVERFAADWDEEVASRLGRQDLREEALRTPR